MTTEHAGHYEMPIPCEKCVREFLQSLLPGVDAASAMHCPHESGGVLMYCRVESGKIATMTLSGPVQAEAAQKLIGHLGESLREKGLLPKKPASSDMH